MEKTPTPEQRQEAYRIVTSWYHDQKIYNADDIAGASIDRLQDFVALAVAAAEARGAEREREKWKQLLTDYRELVDDIGRHHWRCAVASKPGIERLDDPDCTCGLVEKLRRLRTAEMSEDSQ